MAADFWEAQRKARSRTTFFVVLFILLTIAMATFVELGMRFFDEEYAMESAVPWLGILFALITFSVAGIQYLNFKSSGGAYVAKALGGVEVSSMTSNPKERQLLNVVEEMAVAASIPVPPVYILRDIDQINAFAAGLSNQDSVVAVTEGTLNLLNREELQGVVAHEMGHIYNGDMTVNMRLAAMVMGFFFILYIGLRMFQLTSYRIDENKRGSNPIAIAALLFLIAGAFTWFFGSILKSAVSREREYLADACAVQFTRNPDGIANALIKIAKETSSDMPATGASYSHLYLDDRSPYSGLFLTHPPIYKRIEAILGRKYIPPDWNIPPN
jgi:heat shock protein HtpX